MPRRLLLTLLVLGCAEMLTSQTTGPRPPRVRFDGVYYARVGRDTVNPTNQWFRFYEDSSGITSSSQGTPAQIARWFNKDHESSLEGRFRLVADTLYFIIGKEDGARSEYRGVLTAQGWTLQSTGTTFRFAAVTFPKVVVRPGQNRPPRIAPTVSTENAFDYDNAGNLTGVITTITITAADPDGDALKYEWSSSDGRIIGAGPRATWRRLIVDGRPAAGLAVVTVTDGRGGKSTRQFSF